MDVLIDDQMVISVPHSLVTALANLTDDRINDIATKWAEADVMEIRASSELPSLLKAMRELCSQSVATGKKVNERAA